MQRPSGGDHSRSEQRDVSAVARSLRHEQRKLGERMLALREERRATQKTVASAIHLSARQLQRMELGQANVTLGTLVACTVVYNVDLRELFAEQSETRRRSRTLRTPLQEQERLGVRVRGLRQARNLTQEQAAERAGVSEIQYGRLERGQANVSLSTLVGVAHALRVRLGELFDE